MTLAGQKDNKYSWFSIGDINGFFGLMIDNMTVLSLMSGILIFVFKFPSEIIFHKMIPGTALGVLFGDLVYTWMAIKLAKKTGNNNVTAMPLGLDTPSSIGIAFTVLGPCFLLLKNQGMDDHSAGMMTWYVGMAVMMYMGVIKLVFSFVGGWIQKIVPQAGLLGSLAGIGLALIAFIPMVEIFRIPLIGILSMGIILYSLVAGIRLPKHFPSVLLAIIGGTLIYYFIGSLNKFGIHIPLGMQFVGAPEAKELHMGFPVPTLGFINGLKLAINYLPVAIPFGILTVIGGINVTESARVAGDDFKTRDILLTEAIATLIAGVCGGVAQSTPYIGQPAYKSMGAKSGYTLLTGLFIGIGGMFGIISYIVELIPAAVLAPILLFVALDIMTQAYLACPKEHAPAVSFAFVPTVARLVVIKLMAFLPSAMFAEKLVFVGQGVEARMLPELMVTVALGNGFIVTGMLWGAFLALLIDRKLIMAANYLFIMAFLSFFGIIHSGMADGNMYLPWLLQFPVNQIPYQFAMGYAVLGIVILFLSLTKASKEPVEPMHI